MLTPAQRAEEYARIGRILLAPDELPQIDITNPVVYSRNIRLSNTALSFRKRQGCDWCITQYDDSPYGAGEAISLAEALRIIRVENQVLASEIQLETAGK